MNCSDPLANLSLMPTVFYVHSDVNCSLVHAWKILIDYEAWNPTFVDAKVVPVSGDRNIEGGIVLIKKKLQYVDDQPLPQFFAMTVKVVPGRRICWFVYPTAGNTFRNFVDFGLSEISGGVRFNICYYAQDQLYGDTLTNWRKNCDDIFAETVLAFKTHCEAKK